MIKKLIRKIFHLRKDVEINFYVTDFIFRKVFRQNSSVNWAVHHTATIRSGQNIKRGKESYPGDSPGVYINAYNGVEIGAFVNVGPHVHLISSNHNFFENEKVEAAPPIQIGDHSWIGSHAVLLPGVVLGKFTIVGAGAVVTKSFPDGYVVIGGNPAHIIRQLNKEICEKFAVKKFSEYVTKP